MQEVVFKNFSLDFLELYWKQPSYQAESSILTLKADGAIEHVGPFGVLIHLLHLKPGVDPLPQLG